MSKHHRGRHRAPSRLSASLGTTARVSAAVAVSGGLIAAVAAPANATEAVGTLATTPAPAAPTGAPVGSAVSQGAVAQGMAELPDQVRASDLVRPRPRAAAHTSQAPATERASRSSQRSAATASSPNASARADSSSRSSSDSQSSSGGSKPSSESSSTPSSSRIVDIAKKYIGTPYIYGGSTPAGFDCSGFTGHVYKQVGISLPRSARAQQAAATRVSSPRPGDLVFYNFPATHVMIYVGGGMVIDSPSPGKTVQVHKMWGSNISYGRVG